MQYNIYSILDHKTGFINMTLDQNDETAKRNFAHACQVTDSLFYTHPDDYSLYCIGEFNTDSGIIEPVIPPKNIVDARQFVKVGDNL